MARPKTSANISLLEFAETRNYIQGSIGAKMASLSKVIKEDTRSRRESTLLKDLAQFVEYMGKNPFEICEYVRAAIADREKLPEVRAKLENFPKWLISEKKQADTSANTRYGNARGFLKHNNCRITLKNYSPKSNKAAKLEENAIKFSDLFAIAKKMYTYGADFETKAWMACALNAGLRNSDLIRMPLKELKNKLAKVPEYLEMSHPAWKQSNEKITYLAELHRISQLRLKEYLETIKDDREFAFGGKASDTDSVFDKIERNIANKIAVLYQNCAPEEFKSLNLITPHTFRAFFETILGNHGIPKDQVYRLDGHMPGNLDVYNLPSDVFASIIRACERELNFEDIDLTMKSEEEIKLNFLKQLMDLIDNKGKRDTLIHRVSVISENDKMTVTEQIDAQASLFIEKFTDSIKKSILDELKKQ